MIKFKRRSAFDFKKLVGLVLLVVLLFIYFNYILKAERKLFKVEQVFKDIVVTTQKYLYYPGRFFLNGKDVSNGVGADILLALKQEQEALKRELKALQALTTITSLHTDYQTVAATVINRNVGTWFNTLTIDKGTKHGLKKDQVAVVNNNLVGIIMKTTPFTSEVKLITKRGLKGSISVAIINEEAITYGLINGYQPASKTLIVDHIIDETVINKGDKVITSGLSNHYPEGILVGEVVDSSSDDFGLARIVSVKSYVDFNNLRFITILIKEEDHD